MPELVAGGLTAGPLVAVVSSWLLTYLLHSTVVVGAVWFLWKMGWVHRPTTLDLLWKVALVAGLATASVATFRTDRVELRQLRVEVERSVTDSDLTWRSEAAPGVGRIRATAVTASPECAESLDRLRRGSPADIPALSGVCGGGPGLPWRSLLAGFWILGGAGLVARAVVVRRALGRALADARPAPEALRVALRGLVPGMRRFVDVVVSPSMEAPCVVGGRIVLPVRCVTDLSPDQLRSVLAHEVAHLVRWDPAWITFGDLVGRVLWVQPLNRLAVHRLQENAELVCDDWAVERVQRPRELASSIARVAEWIHPGRRVPAPALAHLSHLAQGSGRVLSGRVRRILNQGVARRASPWAVRMLLAVLVVAPTLMVPAVPRATIRAVFIQRAVGEGVSLPPGGAHEQDVVIRVRRLP